MLVLAMESLEKMTTFMKTSENQDGAFLKRVIVMGGIGIKSFI